MSTKVIFRKFKNGEVIALFPEEIADNNPFNCLSYMHIGQHGAASQDIVYDTKPCKENEYSELKKELEGIGYEFEVITKFTNRHSVARIKLFNSFHE